MERPFTKSEPQVYSEQLEQMRLEDHLQRRPVAAVGAADDDACTGAVVEGERGD